MVLPRVNTANPYVIMLLQNTSEWMFHMNTVCIISGAGFSWIGQVEVCTHGPGAEMWRVSQVVCLGLDPDYTNNFRARARHFENGVLDAYGTHCKHDYKRYHSYFCVHVQKHAYFGDGTVLSRALNLVQDYGNSRVLACHLLWKLPGCLSNFREILIYYLINRNGIARKG